MTLALDHVLITVDRLQQAMDDYAALGFRVRRSATDAVGTQSANVDFADGSRLQLHAWTIAAPENILWRHLQQRGEGIAAYAVAAPRPDALPYGLVLRTREPEPWIVDLRLSHGAAIELVPSTWALQPSALRQPAAMVGG